MQPIKIKYDVAIILSANGHDIAVYDLLSGDIFSFSHPEWSLYGTKTGTRKRAQEGLGILEMDDQYNFIWLSNRK